MHRRTRCRPLILITSLHLYSFICPRHRLECSYFVTFILKDPRVACTVLKLPAFCSPLLLPSHYNFLQFMFKLPFVLFPLQLHVWNMRNMWNVSFFFISGRVPVGSAWKKTVTGRTFSHVATVQGFLLPSYSARRSHSTLEEWDLNLNVKHKHQHYFSFYTFSDPVGFSDILIFCASFVRVGLLPWFGFSKWYLL